MFYFGVDYYPEHWPESRWAEDARLMQDAGFNVVRLAEFAWAQLEPAEGQFDFSWLDRAIELLAHHGIKIVLGTPTASPPAWLMHSDSSLFRMLPDGRRVAYGHRREYCPNHTVFQRHARQIAACMAERYGQHPAVIGWQIDNEFGDRCYCPVCNSAFHVWLQNRYGTLDTVNERWGTAFWSHRYTAWDQIPVPSSTAWPPNPGLGLDYYRFCSDSYVALQQQQIDILRAAAPGRIITHNFMGFPYDQINYFDLARPLDLVAWDNYPRLQWNINEPFNPALPGLSHDTMRGLKRRPFWVMEQQAGPAGWDILGPTPRPGQLRLWAYQAIAHGADGIIFFRWRTATVGAEQNWHGVLDHDGRPGRRYEEIRQMGREIKTIGRDLIGTQPQAQTAIVLSYDSRFAFQIQRHNPGFDYSLHVRELYYALRQLNVAVDVVDPNADLSAYRLVFAPALHVVTEESASNLERYVSAGGTLLITARSGVKDDANRVVDRPLPGLLADLCGIEVEEYDSLPADQSNAVRFVWPDVERGPRAEVRTWCEVLRLRGAEALAHYQCDFYTGRPAITLHRVGEGQAVYCGVFGTQDILRPLLQILVELADMGPLASPTHGLDIVERSSDTRAFLFAFNHTDRECVLPVTAHYLDVLDGSPIQHEVRRIGPYDLAILEEKKGSEA